MKMVNHIADFDVCNKKKQWISPLKNSTINLYIPVKMNGTFANYFWTMFWGSVCMFDLRMIINMSSQCEYDWCWKISACTTEYETCDSFTSLTRQQTSFSGSAGWYFRYQSIHIQITYANQSFMSFKTFIHCIKMILQSSGVILRYIGNLRMWDFLCRCVHVLCQNSTLCKNSKNNCILPSIILYLNEEIDDTKRVITIR